MRTSFLILILAVLSFASCSGGAEKKEKQQLLQVAENPDRVEVLYFHGKQRCITCNAIEKLTQEVVETDFSQALADGDLVFRIIDISEDAHAEMADRYEVTWASLFINKWDKGVEARDNMTDFGFTHAKNSPEIFKEGVRSKIKTLLDR